MTDIVRYNDTLDHPELLNTSHKLATQICRTEFVPKALRDRPEATLAALLAGRELGLGPMTALNHVNIIEGRSSFSAQLQRAVAMSAGHQIDVVETTPERCVVVARRAGSEHTVRIEWTMADAKRAGLDGKQNWRKNPRQMLQARATAEAARLVAPDATLGIPLTVEEAADGDPLTLEPEPTVVERTVRRRAKKAEPEPASAPALAAASADDGDVVEAEVIDHPASDPPSDAQKGKFFALCSERGLSNDDRHWLIGQVTGGRTESWNDVTKAEAARLIDRLEQPPTQDDEAADDGDAQALPLGDTGRAWDGWGPNDWLGWARTRGVKLVDLRPLGITSYADIAAADDDVKARAWALPDQLEEPF